MTNIIIKYFKDDVFFQVGVTPVTVGFLEALDPPSHPVSKSKNIPCEPGWSWTERSMFLFWSPVTAEEKFVRWPGPTNPPLVTGVTPT